MHDQSEHIDNHTVEYERQLPVGGLRDVPFHMVDLLHGHRDYEGLDTITRKRLLSRFNAFVRRLPISDQPVSTCDDSQAVPDNVET
jgi:hypothetical protein